MATYFDNLRYDRAALSGNLSELYRSNSPYNRLISNTPIYDPVSLVEYFKDMGEDQPNRETTKNLLSTDLKTNIGKRGLFLASHNVEYNVDANCCEESEPRLIRALQEKAIQNDKFKSPLIVTHEDQPVALIKQFGERTAFGLEDVPEHGIYRGLFHSAMAANRYHKDALKADHAWKLPLESENGAGFQPIRFSLFEVPVNERYELIEIDYDQDDLSAEDMNAPQEYTTDDIHELVLAAHRHAKPLS